MVLINSVCTADKLTEAASTLATNIALKPPRTLRRAKALLKHDRHEVVRQIEAEILEFSECLDSPENAEALTAFAKKRKPVFSQF